MASRIDEPQQQVHWQHSNHFVHYGGAGLNMLAPHTMGFLQEFDGGFRFDDVARSKSDRELIEQLAARIFDQPRAVGFSAIFAQTCNGPPATASMYKDALATLGASGDVVVKSSDGKRRYQGRYIQDSERGERARQLKLFLPPSH